MGKGTPAPVSAVCRPCGPTLASGIKPPARVKTELCACGKGATPGSLCYGINVKAAGEGLRAPPPHSKERERMLVECGAQFDRQHVCSHPSPPCCHPCEMGVPQAGGPGQAAMRASGGQLVAPHGGRLS